MNISAPFIARPVATTLLTLGTTVQPMTLLRSKGRNWPFDYAMTFDLRPGAGLAELMSGHLPTEGWQSRTAPGRLTNKPGKHPLHASVIVSPATQTDIRVIRQQTLCSIRRAIIASDGILPTVKANGDRLIGW